MAEREDAERAMDLLLDFMWWVESTPEPQLELDTSVQWSEGLAFEIQQWPDSTKGLFRQRLRKLAASDEFIEAWLSVLE